ncbi:MAG: metallophosphoesterase family protein [Chlorobi bacterium]|nr:metallophosphoesterase family protein [Chlorobiota bacterium]
MKRIGLLSDTHGFLDSRIFQLFSECDEIWHAGDIGSADVLQRLMKIAPVRAVYGNIDGQEIRNICPVSQRFTCELLNVWITHIGGYPGHFARGIREKLLADPPGLFISGHSHILKIMHDKKLRLLHINPGSAGKQGFHRVRTVVRFEIHGDQVKELEVAELGTR